MSDYHINIFYSEEDSGYIADNPDLESPETSKIAIKVINHYGDEVLKVYEVK